MDIERPILGCELCGIPIRTHWYYQDFVITICDCATCEDSPMVVLNRHTMEPEEWELNHMKEWAWKIFGIDVKFRKEQRKITNHLHWHIIREKSDE